MYMSICPYAYELAHLLIFDMSLLVRYIPRLRCRGRWQNRWAARNDRFEAGKGSESAYISS